MSITGSATSSTMSLPFTKGKGTSATLNGKDITMYTMDRKAASEYIGREMKLDLHANQEKSLIDAMASPQTWITDRKTEMDRIKYTVAKVYADRLNDAYGIFKFSVDDAQAYATKHAQKTLDLELENLEYIMPGATTVYQSAAFTDRARNAQYAMASGQGELDVAAYKRMKKQYKAQKGRSKIEG